MLKQGEADTPVLKLHYFHIRGVAQPVRHLLYHLQAPFQDCLHDRTRDNEVEVGFNLGFPRLEDGQTTLHEAVAIMFYLCRKYERETLLGLTPQTIARVQEVLMKFTLQRKRIMAIVFETFASLPEHPPEARDAYVEAQLRKMVGECRFLEFCLRSLARGKAFVLEELTIVDFVFYEQAFYICGFFQQHISPTGPYALLATFMRRFEKLPFYQLHRQDIEHRPLFHEFNNPDMNRLIEDAWKGARGAELLKRTPQQ